MNEFQRQLLADEIDDVSRTIERYEVALTKLKHQMDVKEHRLKDLRKRKAELEEGVDW